MQTSIDAFSLLGVGSAPAEPETCRLTATPANDQDREEPEVVWFDCRSLTPIPPPLHAVSVLPYGISGNRVWRARGWSQD